MIDFSAAIFLGLHLGSLRFNICKLKFLLSIYLLLDRRCGLCIHRNIREVYGVNDDAVFIKLITQVYIKLRIDFGSFVAKNISYRIICRYLLRPGNNLGFDKCILDFLAGLTLKQGKGFRYTVFVKAIGELQINTNRLPVRGRDVEALIIRGISLALSSKIGLLNTD